MGVQSRLYIQKVKDNIDGRFSKQIENASARVHIRKLEALQLELQATIEELYGKNLRVISDTLGDIYEDTFYHTAYELETGAQIRAGTVGLNKRAIEKAINEPWRIDAQGWSKSLWQNKDKLVQNIQTELTQGLMRGDHPDKVARAISKAMDSDLKNTKRLVRTESAAILNKAQIDCYKDLGINQLKIIGTLDSVTCSLCGGFDGSVIDEKEAKPGITTPPYHPNCRCCTEPYDPDWEDLEDETRIARDNDGNSYYVPANMSFEEWKQRLIGTESKSFKITGVSKLGQNKIHGPMEKGCGKAFETAERRFSREILPIKNVPAFEVSNERGLKSEYSPSENIIRIGSDFSVGQNWRQNTEKLTKEMYRKGQWSSSNINHMYWHELGHRLVHELEIDGQRNISSREKINKAKRLILDAKNNIITSAVNSNMVEDMKSKGLSRYGFETEDEGIAEVCAAYMSGDRRELVVDVINALKG